jgi:2-polyprenyl-3-methyl-5-hydroxy-6-metoxy-1,4-benzoquinol methylase
MSELLEHVVRNRAKWDVLARQFVEAGERSWAQEEPAWGIWQVPEAEVRAFPEKLAGKDAIELGCGTAYISAWLSRRGARIVGVDNSEAQLGTARRLQRQ